MKVSFVLGGTKRRLLGTFREIVFDMNEASPGVQRRLSRNGSRMSVIIL